MGLFDFLGDLVTGGAVSAGKQAKKAHAQTQSQLDAYNKQYGDWQKGLQGFFGQGGAGQAGLFGPQTRTSTQTSREAGTDVSNPFITGEYSPLAGMLRSTYEGRLKKGTSLPLGYAERKAAAINAAGAGAAQAERNFAARRGIPAAEAALGSPAERARQGAILDLETELPLLNRQLQNEDLQAAQALTQAFGRGEQRQFSRTGTTTGEQVGPADVGAIMQYFGMLAPREPTILQPPQTQSFAGALGGQLMGAAPLIGGFFGKKAKPQVQTLPTQYPLSTFSGLLPSR
jgi:hypothetical protein